MKLMKKNSPKNKVSMEDLKIPLVRLMWALIGVIALWLNVDLPDALNDGTTLNLALSGLSMWVAGVIIQIIKDNSGIEPGEK